MMVRERRGKKGEGEERMRVRVRRGKKRGVGRGG